MMPVRYTTKLLILITIGLLAFSLLGGAGEPPVAEAQPKRQPKAARKFYPGSVPVDSVTNAYCSSVNRFGFDLLHQVLGSKISGNTVLCPTSAALVLAMAYNGTEGKTKQAMAEALGFQGLSLDDLNRASKALARLLDGQSMSAELNIANSIWMKDDFQFRRDFLDINQASFGAELRAVDFLDPATVQAINQWCAVATNDKIQRIFNSLDPETVMVLINALYFSGRWTEAFTERLTENEDFFLMDGSAIKHPLMRNRAQYAYFETDDFQAIRLPYGNERLEMQIYLPANSSSIQAFLENLTDENWQAWQHLFSALDGEIVLPRFKIKFESDLSPALKSMGMALAFDRIRADFSGMAELSGDSILFVQQVKQKTYLDVNEKGTQAAAVTAVTMGLATCAAPTHWEPFRMEVNRPFYLSIVDRATGLRLFDAVIVDPRG